MIDVQKIIDRIDELFDEDGSYALDSTQAMYIRIAIEEALNDQ